MPTLRAIEIDFDVHRLIEGERRGFEDSPNAALRRLLNLGDAPKPIGTESAGRPWSDEGVTLPHGTKVRMYYGRNRQLFEGEIVDGQWIVGGRKFDSPSGAASELALTKRGKKTRLNGWNYWEAKRLGDDSWQPIDEMRPQTTLADLGLE